MFWMSVLVIGKKGDYYKHLCTSINKNSDEWKSCVWNDLSNWWHNFHFCLNYPFNKWWTFQINSELDASEIRRRSSIQPTREIFSNPPDDCVLESSSCESHPEEENHTKYTMHVNEEHCKGLNWQTFTLTKQTNIHSFYMRAGNFQLHHNSDWKWQRQTLCDWEAKQWLPKEAEKVIYCLIQLDTVAE